ncbi:MAG: TonB-dependent receptor [Bacteroidales bacterium]|jgi:TonB-linked SusC/RagA family outer membrane protein|nr:TonB-dependent receptor [Bacteroidales bacterium]
MKLKIVLLLSGLLLGTALSAQQRETFVIEGTVYDETGEAMPGATVYIKDKINVGTTTDINGKFSIKADKGNLIVFSFVGYKSIEYYVTGEKKDLEVRFVETVAELDEVVVTALGSQRKISSVAAVTVVDVKELQTPTTSVANLLGGKVAGIISMQTSGEPGKNIADFWVRGIGTFGYDKGALVLIDGLEGDLNSVDPADIESFSILKDASATAVYGVRGANGVVLITTKRGEDGKLSITGRANFSLSRLKRMPKYLRAYDYAMLANEAMTVRGDGLLYTPIEMDIIRDGLDTDMYPDVSWQDEVMNENSFRQNYYVSARGGGGVARYFLSLGASTETAAYKVDKNSVYSSNVGYNTYTFRTNLDINLTKSTTLYFGTDGFLSIHNQPGIANTDYVWAAQSQLNPLLFPVVYSNGLLPAAGENSGSSPYVLINHTGQRTDQKYDGKLTFALNQDLSFLLEGLKIRAQGAYDITSWFNEMRFVSPALYRAVGRSATGSLVMRETYPAQSVLYGDGTNQYRKYHFESTLNYDKLLGEDHRVSGLVYYYLSDQKNSDYPDTSLEAIPVRYQGVSSRLTYNFKDTYMIDVNFGYTGSENFQPGRQYGFFPSVALGWVPTSYAFVKEKMSWLNFFKIRGSYGAVGNDRITDKRFPYLTMVGTGSGAIGGVVNTVETVNEAVVGADNLAWEKAIKSDLGIEGRLWKDKFTFVVDFFQDQRDGIFQQREQVPDYVGVVTMPFGNIGKMKSYGSDGNASFIHELNKNMRFTVRGNFTYSKNVVQNWEQPFEKYPYLERVGLPNNVVWGYQSLGLFKTEDEITYSPKQNWGVVQPGDVKYKDVNGDGKINSDDRVPISYSNYPLLMYGMGGEFGYKNLTVGIMFKGTGKTDYYRVGQSVSHSGMTYNNGVGYVPFHSGEQGNVLTLANDPANRWIPMDYAIANGIDPALAENPNALFPKLKYGYNENNSQLSDFWKGNSRYLRLQEVTINYNLRNNGLRKIGISSLDLQLIGTNLYVWDKVKTFDPEQAQFNGRVYPIPAVYALQIYINL